jgi:hypothetical protein
MHLSGTFSDETDKLLTAPCGYEDGPYIVKHSNPDELRKTEGYLRAQKMTEEQ